MGLLSRKKHNPSPPGSSQHQQPPATATNLAPLPHPPPGNNLPSPPRSPIEATGHNRPFSSSSKLQQQSINNPASFSSASDQSSSNVLRNDLVSERSSATTANNNNNNGSHSDREMEGKMLGLELRGPNSSPTKRAGRDSIDSVHMNDGGVAAEQQQPHPVPRQQVATQPSSYNHNNTIRPISSATASSIISPTPSQTSSFARKTSSRYSLADFTFIRTLGTGSFGRVHLVRSRHNQRSYAIKVLLKERVVKMKQVEHTNSEREMLERVRHPFLVNLWGTFKDSRNLYMVMDFVAGGELFSLLRKSQRFPDPVAKFFAAEVALALDYLHSLDIIYRDLKPENILLGADGHVKITDFGFAKYVPDITWTLCGTPDYLAPEIVQSRGYNKSVDWYALGVLMFEMLAGYPPFFTEDSNPMRLYEKIIAGKVRYPSYFTPEAKDLLKALLTPDITKRFGNLANGSRDIFGHVWFQEVDWERLYRKEIPAPYVPKVEGDWDASNFDVYPEIDLGEYGVMGPDPHGHLFPSF